MNRGPRRKEEVRGELGGGGESESERGKRGQRRGTETIAECGRQGERYWGVGR